jgi:SAM-dependent methyltransferase
MSNADLLPTRRDLQERFNSFYGDVRKHGWRIRMWHRFNYFNSEAWYEAVVDRLVTRDCSWLDVGGGKSLFPHNQILSKTLSERCAFLVGVDPSENIFSNPYIHDRARCTIEEFTSDRRFDLATLRMVAEHIQKPRAVIDSFARLMKPGSKVVIYTPHRWSPVSVAASMIPFSLHQPITHFLWGSEEDVFPTLYRMNTRRRLRDLFHEGGFKEIAFAHLDCNLFQRFRVSCFLELSVWWVLRNLHLRYPENDLLGIYERL